MYISWKNVLTSVDAYRQTLERKHPPNLNSTETKERNGNLRFVTQTSGEIQRALAWNSKPCSATLQTEPEWGLRRWQTQIILLNKTVLSSKKLPLWCSWRYAGILVVNVGPVKRLWLPIPSGVGWWSSFDLLKQEQFFHKHMSRGYTMKMSKSGDLIRVLKKLFISSTGEQFFSVICT